MQETCLDRTGDTDEEILKRMEEILLTYKCKVEDKLAAEGKQLPKVRLECVTTIFSTFHHQDIFDDFTEHWVNSSPHRAKSVDSLDSSERPGGPSQRKEYRDGQRNTKIPAPTFYRDRTARDK